MHVQQLLVVLGSIEKNLVLLLQMLQLLSRCELGNQLANFKVPLGLVTSLNFLHCKLFQDNVGNALLYFIFRVAFTELRRAEIFEDFDLLFCVELFERPPYFILHTNNSFCYPFCLVLVSGVEKLDRKSVV